MLLSQAIDEFILYIQIEKNYSQHTIDSYSFDLKLFESFLIHHGRSLEINDITKTNVRRFIQEKVTKEQMKFVLQTVSLPTYRSSNTPHILNNYLQLGI